VAWPLVIQVTLASGCQGEISGGEPVEQGDRGPDVAADPDGLGVGGFCAPDPAAQPAEQVPDGVAVQEFPFARAGPAGDDAGDPALQPGHLLISPGQGPGGDQHAAQVLDRLAGGQLVQGLVRERPLRGPEVTQDGWRRAAVQPRCHCGGPSDRGECLVEALQPSGNLSVLAAEQLTQPLVHRATGAPAGVDAARLPAARAAAPEA
jgi:hypothetical protein